LKLYVISDTHYNSRDAVKIYNNLEGIDKIIHLGDMENDARSIEIATGKEVISVLGNNEFSSVPLFHILETEYGKIFLTHGHKERVKSGLQNLVYKAMEHDCNAAFFGHTHMPFYMEVDGIHLLNPGSLTLPMVTYPSTYAIVEITKDSFFVTSCTL